MTVDYVMIGKHIKKKRKEIGFTQERLAEKINVTVGYISQLERGITKVNLDMLAKIGTVLNTELPYFLSGTVTSQNSYLQYEFSNRISMLDEEQRQILSGIIDVLLNHPRRA